ncbi:STY0301 family protein [Inhella sp.]|uniref:STY0301 family protein n=1 Tax=Inhella sp. TaxID=1921806 RepID=UPI0035AEE023
MSRWHGPATLLALAAPLLALADTTASVSVCPIQPGKALRQVTVFDGPPEELASLVPEPDAQGRDSWPLAYVYQAGRQVWVHCQYQGEARRVLQLPEPVRHCHFLPKRRGQAEAQLRCTPVVAVVERKAE